MGLSSFAPNFCFLNLLQFVCAKIKKSSFLPIALFTLNLPALMFLNFTKNYQILILCGSCTLFYKIVTFILKWVPVDIL